MHDVRIRCGGGEMGGGGVCCGVVQGGPDVLVNADGLIGAPEETAAEEGNEKEDAVKELGE